MTSDSNEPPAEPELPRAIILSLDDELFGRKVYHYLRSINRARSEAFPKAFVRAGLAHLPGMRVKSEFMAEKRAVSLTGFKVGSVSLAAKKLPEGGYDFEEFPGANIKAGPGSTTCGERYSVGGPWLDDEGPYDFIPMMVNTGVPDEKHVLPMNGEAQRVLRPCVPCMEWLISLARAGMLIYEWTVFVLVNHKTREVELITFWELVQIFSSLKNPDHERSR